MNTYEISYSMFRIENNKISIKNHFSNCKSTIEGNTFDEAVGKFKEQQLAKGWFIDFVVEGDMFEVTLFDLKDYKNFVKDLSVRKRR